MKYCLFNRDPQNALLTSPNNWVVFHPPKKTKQPGGLDIPNPNNALLSLTSPEIGNLMILAYSAYVGDQDDENTLKFTGNESIARLVK